MVDAFALLCGSPLISTVRWLMSNHAVPSDRPLTCRACDGCGYRSSWLGIVGLGSSCSHRELEPCDVCQGTGLATCDRCGASGAMYEDPECAHVYYCAACAPVLCHLPALPAHVQAVIDAATAGDADDDAIGR